MALYDDSATPVPASIAVVHGEELASFAAPGSWLTGEERSAVVAHARAVRVAAGVQAAQPADVRIEAAAVLPGALLALIETLALRADTLTIETWQRAAAVRTSETEYVEVVALVARIVNLDIFARGLGLLPRALPAPRAGEPDYERPRSAVMEGAWVATVPGGEQGGEDAQAIYGGGMMPFIYRAVSLVPAEARRIIAAGNVQYLGLDKFFDFTYSLFPGLSRPQVEVVAGRISARHACFY